MGNAPASGEEDPEFINAGKRYVTAIPDAAYFYHADSFAMTCGQHMDICVPGAMQVSGKGNLVNWSSGAPGDIPAVGGSMDLVVGVKMIYVITQHCTRDGQPK